MKKTIVLLLLTSLGIIYTESLFHTLICSVEHLNIFIFVLLPISFIFSIITTIWIFFLKVKHKSKILSVSIILLGVSILYRGHITSYSDYINFYISKSGLENFVEKINKYEKITKMSNCNRGWKFINEHRITFSEAKVDTNDDYVKTLFWKNALQLDNIDSLKFMEFRKCLINNRLLLFSKTDDYIDFLINGYSGIIYSNLNTEELTDKFKSVYRRLRNPNIRKVTENWYVY